MCVHHLTNPQTDSNLKNGSISHPAHQVICEWVRFPRDPFVMTHLSPLELQADWIGIGGCPTMHVEDTKCAVSNRPTRTERAK
jgi:hypothetical protein